MPSKLSYLTKVDIDNFRCFGSFSLDFPAKPGIVILVGPNGLGKTSFFEAIEIALVGKVARWQDVELRSKVKAVPVRQGAERARSLASRIR